MQLPQRPLQRMADLGGGAERMQERLELRLEAVEDLTARVKELWRMVAGQLAELRGDNEAAKLTSSNSWKVGPLMAPVRLAKRPLLSAAPSSFRCLICRTRMRQQGVQRCRRATTYVDGEGVALEEETQVGIADEHGVRDNLHERRLQT